MLFFLSIFLMMPLTLEPICPDQIVFGNRSNMASIGGQDHWTVGLVATLISIKSIIAVDKFAYLGGKVLRLINISAMCVLFHLATDLKINYGNYK